MFTFDSFGPLLRGNSLQWNTDNKGVEAIIPKGSRKEGLHKIALKIFRLCIQRQIDLQVAWIPRTLNERADLLSRVIDLDDCSVSQEFFEMVKKRLECKFTVDRIANHINKKCKRFFSPWWVPETEGVNAFSQNWTGEENWLVPPIQLVPCTIEHVIQSNCYAALVVPEWKSQIFWPKLFPCRGSSPKQLSRVFFEDGKGVFQAGTQQETVFSGRFRGRVLVARFEPVA